MAGAKVEGEGSNCGKEKERNVRGGICKVNHNVYDDECLDSLVAKRTDLKPDSRDPYATI